jgi:hypothetical protein
VNALWRSEAPPLALVAVGVTLLLALPVGPGTSGFSASAGGPSSLRLHADSTPVSNFSAALQRLVALLGVAGGALLALVWARVALSWFSSDVGKKISAKDRARDALVGTLLFTAALTGLIWGLARWVLTGS